MEHTLKLRMIVGIGCDIVEIARIEHMVDRFGESFLKRVFTEQEQAELHGVKTQYLAGRFAAKEATVKALGTGFSQGIELCDISVCREESGAPVLLLEGHARHVARVLGVTRSFVSISHEKTYAIAYVLLEGAE